MKATSLNEARKRVLSSPSYWLEGFRIALVKLLGDSPYEMNQTELAESLEISKGAVSTFLHRDGDFRVSKYLKIVTALGFSPILLFVRTQTLIEAEEMGISVFNKTELDITELKRLFKDPSPLVVLTPSLYSRLEGSQITVDVQSVTVPFDAGSKSVETSSKQPQPIAA